MSVEEIDEAVLSHSNVSVLALDPDVSPAKRSQVETAFLTASLRYSDRCYFAIIDEGISKDYGLNSSTKLPFYAFYRDGEPLASYTYPEHDYAFLTSLSLFLDITPPTITNYNDLVLTLAFCPFTILTPSVHYEHAINLQYQASSDMGPINVVLVSRDILEHVGIAPRSMALFRAEDGAFTQLHSVLSVNELYAASYPVFRYLMESDLTTGLVFALLGDTYSDPQKEFLYNVGNRFPDVIVGYAAAHLESTIAGVTGDRYDGSLTVALFDLEKGLHYNISEFFTPALFAMGFDPGRWEGAASELIRAVQQNRSQPLFLSENPDDQFSAKNRNSAVEKLVGATYADFVLDEKSDGVVFYKRESCPHCASFYPVFQRFAEEVQNLNEKMGEIKVRFGIIDVGKNSAPIGFPYMQGVPHIHIFPANYSKTRNSDAPMRGERDRNQLIRLVKKYGNSQLPMTAPLPDKAQVGVQLFQLLLESKGMPQAEQMKTLDYLKELSAEIGVPLDEKDKEEKKKQMTENL